MKTLITLSFFLLFSSLNSCSDSNDKNTATSINGVWNLRYVNGSITGASYVFEPGVVTWNFNTATNQVTVVNNNTNNNLNSVLNSGVYTYTITSNPDNTLPCSQVIRIDTQDMGCLSITSTQLIMNQTFADGIQIELNR